MAKQAVYRHRFVIHLPTLDNDGNKINLSLIQRAFNELKRHFGGYTTSSYIGYPNYAGFYRSPDGTSYTDYIYIIYVDVEDSQIAASAIKFFEKFRDRYTALFQQSGLYIIYYPVTKI
jgi:hypothetical protein